MSSRLAGAVRLADLLIDLTVLIPVFDGVKHYHIGDDEVQKLLRRGDGWLEAHPDRELIVRRYLRFDSLVHAARASFDEQVVAERVRTSPRARRPRRRWRSRSVSTISA